MPGPISEPWTGENFEPDIVTRLLDVFEIFEDGCPDLYPAAYKEVARDAKEAADEIERLRAERAAILSLEIMDEIRTDLTFHEGIADEAERSGVGGFSDGRAQGIRDLVHDIRRRLNPESRNVSERTAT